jgi:cobalt/nickel transport system permease protein
VTTLGRARSRSAFEHTLRDVTQALERGLFAEELSRRAGLFQSLDPRVKLISVLALLLVVSLSHSLAVIVSIYGVVLILASLSAISPGLLIRRVWIALPFFTGLIVLPALFLTPGPRLVQFPGGLAITQTGMMTGLFLLLRVSTSLSLTLLLVLTTPWNTLLSALGALRVPEAFVMILGMAYRYIHLLLRITNDMFLSRQSRTVGHVSIAENQRGLAAIAGTLLGKSLTLSGEVYLAMQSRGFRGSIATLAQPKLQRVDWIWLMLTAAITAVCIFLGR